MRRVSAAVLGFWFLGLVLNLLTWWDLGGLGEAGAWVLRAWWFGIFGQTAALLVLWQLELRKRDRAQQRKRWERLFARGVFGMMVTGWFLALALGTPGLWSASTSGSAALSVWCFAVQTALVLTLLFPVGKPDKTKKVKRHAAG